MSKVLKKKSLVGWTSRAWSLYRGVVEISHWGIFVKKEDSSNPIKVRITIEELPPRGRKEK